PDHDELDVGEPAGDLPEVELGVQLGPGGGSGQDRLPHLQVEVDDGFGGSEDLVGQLEVLGADQDPHERVLPAGLHQEEEALDELVLEAVVSADEGLRLADQRSGSAHHHGQDQAVPVGEVAVDGRAGDTGHLGDVLHRRLHHAVTLEAGLGGVDEVGLGRLAVLGDYSLATGHAASWDASWVARKRANSSGIGWGRSVVRMTTFSASNRSRRARPGPAWRSRLASAMPSGGLAAISAARASASSSSEADGTTRLSRPI